MTKYITGVMHGKHASYISKSPRECLNLVIKCHLYCYGLPSWAALRQLSQYIDAQCKATMSVSFNEIGCGLCFEKDSSLPKVSLLEQAPTDNTFKQLYANSVVENLNGFQKQFYFLFTPPCLEVPGRNYTEIELTWGCQDQFLDPLVDTVQDLLDQNERHPDQSLKPLEDKLQALLNPESHHRLHHLLNEIKRIQALPDQGKNHPHEPLNLLDILREYQRSPEAKMDQPLNLSMTMLQDIICHLLRFLVKNQCTIIGGEIIPCYKDWIGPQKHPLLTKKELPITQLQALHWGHVITKQHLDKCSTQLLQKINKAIHPHTVEEVMPGIFFFSLPFDIMTYSPATKEAYRACVRRLRTVLTSCHLLKPKKHFLSHFIPWMR